MRKISKMVIRLILQYNHIEKEIKYRNNSIICYKLEDIIPKAKVSEYEEIHYRFYEHTLPNMSQETQSKMPDVLSKDFAGAKPYKLLYLVGGVFLLLAFGS